MYWTSCGLMKFFFLDFEVHSIKHICMYTVYILSWKYLCCINGEGVRGGTLHSHVFHIMVTTHSTLSWINISVIQKKSFKKCYRKFIHQFITRITKSYACVFVIHFPRWYVDCAIVHISQWYSIYQTYKNVLLLLPVVDDSLIVKKRFRGGTRIFLC